MRETRSYGSARGVRSNPYPYRDAQPLSLSRLNPQSRALILSDERLPKLLSSVRD